MMTLKDFLLFLRAYCFLGGAGNISLLWSLDVYGAVQNRGS